MNYHDKRFRCIVAGSRTFCDYEYLKAALDLYLCLKTNLEIVSGGAIGADKLGEKWAKENGYDLKLFPADWTKNGKAAGPIRNKEMAQYADACIVFWDGKSKGTKNMIDLAKSYRLQLIIDTNWCLLNSDIQNNGASPMSMPNKQNPDNQK